MTKSPALQANNSTGDGTDILRADDVDLLAKRHIVTGPRKITAISTSKLFKKRLGDWVVNPYVGCEHGCRHCYCPAMVGVKFHNRGQLQSDWGHYIFPKFGIVEAIQKELLRFPPEKAQRTGWGDGWILFSFLTDCYTPAEAAHKLTRGCLQHTLEAGHKVRIQTRSALVERDFDLLAAHRDQVLLGTSLAYLDDKLARVLEPRAAGPTRRLLMLENAAKEGIPIYVAIAPFMPFHDRDLLIEIAAKVSPLNPTEIFCEVLNPKGENLSMMAAALRPDYRELAAVIDQYSTLDWSEFTFSALNFGYRRIHRFVPWPDTKRTWAKELSPPQIAFLDQFLPPAGPDKSHLHSN
jgi:DNA repair photolyase